MHFKLTNTGTYIQLRNNCTQFKTQGYQHTNSQTGVLTVSQSQTKAFLETWMGPTTSPQRKVLAQQTVTLTLRDRAVIGTLIRSAITARNAMINSNQVTDNAGLWPDLKRKNTESSVLLAQIWHKKMSNTDAVKRSLRPSCVAFTSN